MKMTVTIYDPKTPEGMCSDITYTLKCQVHYDPEDYGNGCYVYIGNERGFENFYDMRYDTTFHKDDFVKWLIEWAHNYWSGTNGAYAVKRLTITEDKGGTK